MKRFTKCAVLLALAMVFAGCSNDDEPNEETLQTALNDGGTVNLDDYKPIAPQTYTVSKTTTIKGDAEGANFTVLDNADVTFDGTKGLGRLSVGSSDASRAARAAAGGAKVTLKNGVEAKNVYIYVVCTLNAEDSDSTFGNVVIAEGVASLDLTGNASVKNLVALGDDITIAVAATVTIEKANDTAKDAVKKSDATVGGNIDDIDDDVLEDLESGFEDASKGDGKIISSKGDLTTAVKGIIKAYYDFANKVADRNNSRAAATASSKDDIAGQLNKVFDTIYGAYMNEALRESIINLFIGEGATSDINLNGEINLADIKPRDGMKAFIDLVNHANTKMEEGKTDYTLKSFFGDDYDTVEDFLDIADKYASIPKLYALGKLNVDADNTSKYASAAAKLNLEVEVRNINAMIPELFTAYSNNINHTYVPTSANLPVTAVKPFINLDASADLSKANYDALVNVLEDLPEWGDEPVWEFNERYPTYPNEDDYRNGDGEYDKDAWNKAYNEYLQAYGEYWQKYYAYEAEWDEKWDAYVAEHREELANHFKNAKYPGSYSGNIKAGVSTTVTSSADIPGGIITLSLDASYTSPAKILAFLCSDLYYDLLSFGFSSDDDADDYEYAYPEYRSAVSADSEYAKVLRELKDEYDIIPTVTVTDYSGRQTLSLDLDGIISVIDDVVNNIGDIIQ